MAPALVLQVVLFYGLLAYAQSSLQLGYLPLAVKTPYFNGWIVSNNGTSPERVWPNFYMFNREFGWAGFVRVDNKPFQWMGNSAGSNFSQTVTSDITPTKTVFRIAAGPIQFNVTFLTPVEPNDYVRQSMPFSYMYIDAFSATDSQPHTVQMYSDISAQWVARDDTTQVVWDTTADSDVVYHRATRQSPQSMVDNNNFAEDGVAYYAMLQRPGLTWQTCADVDCRGQFSTNGTLNNTKDTNFREINQSWPVYAFSVDLGTISPGEQPDPVVSTLGFVRNPLVTYTTESSVQSCSAYYMTQYSTPEAAIVAFLKDFGDAQNRNSDLDDKVMSLATTISPQYAMILAFATRQIFASMDITVPSDSNGNLNTSEVRIFMKDMGVSTRANPVDVIYGAFPAILYFNSSIAADLLKPLLEFQSSPGYQNLYAAPDLGANYPNINGNSSNTQSLGVDSSSSMLIMVYAHAVKSGDGSLLELYYPTLQKWADYLVVNALHPPQGSITFDHLNSVNLANAALKGILGIYCMGKINEALKVSNTTYSDQANQLIGTWKQLAISGNNIQSVYGQESSWSLVYNLFPAIWLNTSLIDDNIINNQAQFYAQQSPSEYGFALDTSQPDQTYPHWMLLTAATIPSNSTNVRNEFIDFVYKRVSANTSDFPLPMIEKASTGVGTYGIAGSAIHGAAYGILALSMQNVDIKVNATSPKKSSGSKINVGAIVGGIIGGIVGALALALIIFFWCKNKRKRNNIVTIEDEEIKPRPFNAMISPLQLQHIDYQPVVNGSNTYLNQNGIAGNGNWSSTSEAMTQSRQEGSDVETPSSGAAIIAPRISSKRREALNPRQYHVAAAPSESAVSTLSNPYSTSASGSGTENLRAEVEQLRREMENIRQIAEPPPEYT